MVLWHCSVELVLQGLLQCAVDIVEGFMLSIFVLLTGLRYAHF